MPPKKAVPLTIEDF
jgi:hypothetical protein